MRPATMISLGASTVLGIAALIAARLLLPSHAASAQSTIAPAQVVGVPVVVASQPIPYGVVLEAKYLTVAKLPSNAAPAGAFSSIGQILGQQGGPPTAIVPMQAQEAVLPSKLTGVGERPTLAALISPGMRAFTIAVSEVQGTGGHVMPGDRVDVVLTGDIANQAGGAPSPQRKLVSSLIVQNVRVLGVDQNANPTSATPTIARSTTLEVTLPDAQRLALASQAGTLSLALRKTGSSDIEPPRLVMVSDLGQVAVPVALRGAVDAPVRRHVVSHPHGHSDAKLAEAGTSITIVNGDAAATVNAPSETGVVSFP
jgi:pilus assembly protein CpaB